jgi:hypothetical protein
MKKLVQLLALIALPVSSAVARIDLTEFTYDRLKRESEVVVIAVAKSERSVDERIILPRSSRDVLGVETSFEVSTVLLGTLRDATIMLFHARKSSRQEDDDACMISFDPNPNHAYLLFLKRDKKGRFVPTSGQEFACVSVKDLGFHW